MNQRAPESIEIVVPVIAEEAVVGVVTTETGRVLVHTAVEEHQVQLEGRRARETVEVERVAMDRVVEGPLPVRQEGDTTVVSVVEEVLVVEKRFVLREEVRITRRRTEEVQPITATLKRERVDVERVPRTHLQSNQEPLTKEK